MHAIELHLYSIGSRAWLLNLHSLWKIRRTLLNIVGVEKFYALVETARFKGYLLRTQPAASVRIEYIFTFLPRRATLLPALPLESRPLATMMNHEPFKPLQGCGELIPLKLMKREIQLFRDQAPLPVFGQFHPVWGPQNFVSLAIALKGADAKSALIG